MPNHTRKVNKGGGIFNFFKRRNTKNNLSNLRRHLGYASETPAQKRKRLDTKLSSEYYGPNHPARTHTPPVIEYINELDRYQANQANNNLNKSFDDVLNDIKEFTSNLDSYRVESMGRSNTSNKNFCHVYFIVSRKDRTIMYKIRKCYKDNSNKDEPKIIEIKSIHGKWKSGPYRDENGHSFLQNLMDKSRKTP